MQFVTNIWRALERYNASCSTLRTLQNYGILTPISFSHIDHIAFRGINNLEDRHKEVMETGLYEHGGSFKFIDGITANWYLSRNCLVPRRLFISQINPDHYSVNHSYLNWIKNNCSETINHVGFSVIDIQKTVEKCLKAEIDMNNIDGLIKTSSDGKLHQASTMTNDFGNFVEFVQRDLIVERRFREGFDSDNAFPIFKSTGY